MTLELLGLYCATLEFESGGGSKVLQTLLLMIDTFVIVQFLGSLRAQPNHEVLRDLFTYGLVFLTPSSFSARALADILKSTMFNF